MVPLSTIVAPMGMESEGRMSDLYECDQCGTSITLDEVGFLGPEDSWDEDCSPYMGLECFCIDCASETEEFMATQPRGV